MLPHEYMLYCEHCKVAFLDAKMGPEYIYFKDARFCFVLLGKKNDQNQTNLISLFLSFEITEL